MPEESDFGIKKQETKKKRGHKRLGENGDEVRGEGSHKCSIKCIFDRKLRQAENAAAAETASLPLMRPLGVASVHLHITYTCTPVPLAVLPTNTSTTHASTSFSLPYTRSILFFFVDQNCSLLPLIDT